MDSALWLAYLFDIGWFLLLTGVLMLAAAGLIILRASPLADMTQDAAARREMHGEIAE
jgi:hypothetical protein